MILLDEPGIDVLDNNLWKGREWQLPEVVPVFAK